MKKLMLPFFLCLFCTLATLGQNNVEITLSNGKTVEGVTKTLFTVDDGDVIIVKDAKSGEKSEYKWPKECYPQFGTRTQSPIKHPYSSRLCMKAKTYLPICIKYLPSQIRKTNR